MRIRTRRIGDDGLQWIREWEHDSTTRRSDNYKFHANEWHSGNFGNCYGYEVDWSDFRCGGRSCGGYLFGGERYKRDAHSSSERSHGKNHNCYAGGNSHFFS